MKFKRLLFFTLLIAFCYPMTRAAELGLPEAQGDLIPSPVEADHSATHLVGSRDGTAATKVFSCSLHFPLNSVRFDENILQKCFEGVNPERVSYIHVIATASPDGGSSHNLYLSTRRAGAIEGYLRNRFPDVEVHAFGGGPNPKFGKMARIFIVETPSEKVTEDQGITDVIDTSAAIVMKPQIQFIKPQKQGVLIQAAGGLSSFGAASQPYQYVQLQADYELRRLWGQDRSWTDKVHLGWRYSMNRSNQAMDVHQHQLVLSKGWYLRSFGRWGVDYGARALLGMASAVDNGTDWGTAAFLSVRGFDLSASLEAGTGQHFNWVGLGIGAQI